MKVKWMLGFIPWLGGAVLMYLSFYSHHIGSDAKDLMFTGGFLLAFTSIIIGPSTGAHLSRQNSSSLTLSSGGIWFRFVAGLMDFLFAGVAITFGTRVVVDVTRIAGWAAPPRLMAEGGVLYLIGVLLIGYWLYFACMESSQLEATTGKLMLRLRVTDEEGHRISFGRASLRYVGKLFSLCTFLGGFLVAIFTRRKQAAHDFFAHTVVVDS